MSMSRPFAATLCSGITASGAVAASVLDISHLDGTITPAVHVYGITTATVAVEGSDDGTNWTAVATAVTANGFVSLSNRTKYVRINVTSYTSGTIGAAIFGHEAVTE